MECVLFDDSATISASDQGLGLLAPHLEMTVKHLVVMFDSDLTFDKQINSSVKSSFLQLQFVQ